MTYLDPPKRDPFSAAPAAVTAWWRGSPASLDPELHALLDLLRREEGAIAQRVHDVLDGDPYYIGGVACLALRANNVCGVAAEATEDILRRHGYEGRKVKRTDLDERYPAPDHVFLEVQRSKGEGAIFVDPAYRQFLRVMNIAEEQHPRSDILVLPADARGPFVQLVADLARPSSGDRFQVTRVAGGVPHVREFSIPRAALLPYLQRIWSTESAASIEVTVFS